jgi:hypothetical protein
VHLRQRPLSLLRQLCLSNRIFIALSQPPNPPHNLGDPVVLTAGSLVQFIEALARSQACEVRLEIDDSLSIPVDVPQCRQVVSLFVRAQKIKLDSAVRFLVLVNTILLTFSPLAGPLLRAAGPA